MGLYFIETNYQKLNPPSSKKFSVNMGKLHTIFTLKMKYHYVKNNYITFTIIF